jgi:transposase-like protein
MAANNFTKIVRLHAVEGDAGILSLAQELKLVGIPKKCVECDSLMVVHTDATTADGLVWRCNGKIKKDKKAAKKCNAKQSYRHCTFFEGSHLKLWQILGFIDLWLKSVQLNHIASLVEVSTATVVDWSSFCREVTFDGMVHNAEPLGGPGRTVEIDESKFGKRKYNRGHRVEGKWVFGGVERETGICFMIPVDHRGKDILLAIIKHCILPGTTIISDCWRAYNCLSDEGFIHETVNHSKTFKDPETGAHTNTIEGSWRHAKEVVGTHNRQSDFLAGKLSKYLFLRRCRMLKLDPFLEFCKMAGSLYNGNGMLVESERKQAFDNLQDELQAIYDAL